MVRKRLNHLLRLGVPARHPERSRLAHSVSRYLLGVALMVSAIVTLFALIGAISPQHLVLILIAAAGTLGLAFVVRRGEVEIGVWLFVFLGSLITTAIGLSNGGIQNPVVGMAFMVLILSAGTFLGYRAAALVAAMALLLELAMAVAQLNGRLPMGSTGVGDPLSTLGHHAIMIISAVFLFSLVANTVSGAIERAERELEERRHLEALYRRAISAADAVPYSLDYHTNEYTFIGDGIQKLTGYSAQEISGALFRSLVEKVELHTDLLAASGQPPQADRAVDKPLAEWKSDYRIHTRYREQRWLTDAAVQVFDDEGRPSGAIGLLFDITRRKWAEAALSESERRWRAIFERSVSGIALSNLNGDILESNLAFQRMLGYSGEELHHMRFSELAHPEDLPEELAGVEKLFNGEENFFTMEKRYLRKNGNLLWANMTAALIPGENGDPCFGLAIIDDITERKKAERVLRQINSELEQRARQRTAELEAANRELESFSYSVSHDLRAPLRAIDGYGHLLEMDYASQLEGDGQVLLSNIRQATQKMGHLIDDLLKLSRVSRAEMTIAPVNLSAITGQLLRVLAEQEPERQVQIEVEAELWVQGDASLLQVAMDNLLRNAWKFTSKTGQPFIQVGALKEARPIIYYVRDNGAGFSMQYADKLFIPFQRLHSADEFEGTGVGLATVQRVIQRHSGRLWAESAPGKGATFYFTLG